MLTVRHYCDMALVPTDKVATDFLADKQIHLRT